jgi:pimeloyl-ACP methyl ester carboxylesterase
VTTTDAQAATGYAAASTQRVTADNGIEYAYRDLGQSETPLVLLQHFRGNLDNWDPALIDDLASERRVVTFDNRGVGGTTGMTPNTIEAMAHDAIAFLEAMKFQRVDLLGFSIGASSRRRLRSSAPTSCAASFLPPRHRRARPACTAGLLR